METVDGVFRKQLGAPVCGAREHVGCLRGPRISYLSGEGYGRSSHIKMRPNMSKKNAVRFIFVYSVGLNKKGEMTG